MAAAIPDLETFLKEFGEDYLSCTICLEQYVNPKVLSCDHTFCERCLRQIVAKKGRLQCSVCDTPCDLPDGEVNNLKPNFFMNSLLDIVGRCQPSGVSVPQLCEGCDENTVTNRCVECSINLCSFCTKSHSRAIVSRNHRIITLKEYKDEKGTQHFQPKKIYCNVHPENEVKYFCITCNVTVCTDCAFMKHRTAEHVHVSLQEAVDKYTKRITELVAELKKKSKESEICKASAIQTRDELKQQCREEEKMVRKQAEEFIRQIRKEEERLIEELKTEYGQMVKTAEVEIDEWELKHGNVASTCGYLEAIIQHGTVAQVMTNKEKTERHIGKLISMETKPNQDAVVVKFKPNTDIPIRGIMGSLCKTLPDDDVAANTKRTPHRKGYPVPTTVETQHSLQPHSGLTTNQECGNSMSGVWQLTKLFAGASTSNHGNTGAKATPIIPEICASKCTVENVPRNLTVHESANIVIRTKDSQGRQVIPTPVVKAELTKPDGSRKDVKVTDNRDGTLAVTLTGEMTGRHQVSLTTGNKAIKGSPFIIPIIDSSPKTKTFGRLGSGKGCFNAPRGIAVNKRGQYVVAELLNRRLQVIDRDGNHVKFITFTHFKNPFQPRDIAVSANGDYYMTDQGNLQIVACDEDGYLIGCFGQNEIKYPFGIAISPLDGSIYVSDWDGIVETDRSAHCIRKYNHNGIYMAATGRFGTGVAEFIGPSRICVNRQGILYVPDISNNRIQVLGANLQYLNQFGSSGEEDGKLVWPESVAVDKDGFLYVSEQGSKRVQKFDSMGQFVRRIDSTDDGLQWPCAVTVTDDWPVKVVVADFKSHCLKVFSQ